MASKMVKRKLHGSLEMLVNAAFPFVCKWNYFVKECRISCFRDVFINGRNQPERVVGPVGRMPGFLNIRSIVRRIFMTGIMGKFYQWKPPLSTCAESIKRIFSNAISGARWMMPWISWTVSR